MKRIWSGPSFGIKHGKLRLNLQNGIMPIKEREFIKSEQECLKWIINTTGSDKNPCWEFVLPAPDLVPRDIFIVSLPTLFFSAWRYLDLLSLVTIKEAEVTSEYN